uniref:Single domain-containing protein n=1 Tax=Amblyomma cajennense TaxID=34607 RepID=A0A023FQT6_AMBCJ
MVKILILAIALTACIALGEGRRVNVTSLQFINGTSCIYQGYTLQRGEIKYPSDYCERWQCYPKKKILAVRGCNIGRQYESCFHHTSGGFWPYCCNYYKPYC